MLSASQRTQDAVVDIREGLHVSLFRNFRDRVPQRGYLDPADLPRWVGKPIEIAQADWRPAWSPALYEPGATRKKAHVYAISALVLDYDDGTPWDTGIAPWREWMGLAHTSWSHTPEHHRYRVILPFYRPAHPESWPAIWRWAEARSSRTIDKSCKDASRIYFVPCVQPGHAAFCEYDWDTWRGTAGQMLDVATLELPPDPAKRVVASRPAAIVLAAADGAYTLSSRGRVTLDGRDPDKALRWAEESGGRASTAPSALAEGFGCPACTQCDTWIGRDSVLAMCRHRNTCGWSGRPWAH